MAKVLVRNGNGLRAGTASKYDAHNTVLSKTYGVLADLRRELADSKAAVAEREELLRSFASCADSQRAWLLLEDYFEKLSLSRKDFPSTDWWPRLLAAQGQPRLEEMAFLFLRAKRSVPTELAPYASPDRFAQAEGAVREQQLVQELESWLFPPKLAHLDTPRASLRVLCEPEPDPEEPGRYRMVVRFHLARPRGGDKVKALANILELTTRAAHEQELFAPADWDFMRWLAQTQAASARMPADALVLSDLELLHWLARWGRARRLELVCGAEPEPLEFDGQVAELTPCLENGDGDLSFTHRLTVPGGQTHSLGEVRFFSHHPPIALAGHTFYLVRNAPPPRLLAYWNDQPAVPVRKLSHRLLRHLRRSQADRGVDWEQLCISHAAAPEFIFELLDETVRLRLLARSQRDRSVWIWNGHEWQLREPRKGAEKPEILDDPRLEPTTQWLRQLDWFTPEPGLWVGDATEIFLSTLAEAWPNRPLEAQYLGNPAFHRLFLAPRQLRPRIIVKGSGIDWLAVSAEWEQEGLKLTADDVQRLQTATGRFIKLPDSGWVELDSAAVQTAHETMAELGVDGLAPLAQRIGLENAAHLDEEGLKRFGDSPQAAALRERLKDFKGIAGTALPGGLRAELRPYQKEGYDFLCHLEQLKLGGILADDMGLGKTLQTLAWLAWLKERNPKQPQAVPGHLPGLRPAQLAPRGRAVHPAVEGAGAGKRRGPAQSAQADPGARPDRNQLRPAAARPRGTAEIRLPRRDIGRGPIHQESRRAGHPIRQAGALRASPGPHRHAAREPLARFVEHRGFHPARLSGHPGTVLRDLRAARRRRRVRPAHRPAAPVGQTAPAAAAPARRSTWPKTCRNGSNSGATASSATNSATSIWPSCAAAASR